MKSYSTVDEYIANFPDETADILHQIRNTISATAPEAKEKISYGIPTFTLDGKNLVHFGGYDTFVSLYPGSAGVAAFREKLKAYKTSKGTIQFPLNKPIPYDLIAEITKFCANIR